MRTGRSGALLLIAGLLLGCVNVSSTLTVRPDGSGTVTERMMLPPQVAVMMQSLQQMGDSTTSRDLFTEEEVRKRIESMPGLRLESMTMLSNEQGEGYEAVYAFENLNEANYDPAPGDVLPEDAAQRRRETPFDILSAVDLSFTPGSPAALTIQMPRDEDDSGVDGDSLSFDSSDDPETPREERMLRQILKDSGVRLAVQVEGTIVETNATHRSGSTVTLFDVDFGTLMQDSTAFSRMMSENESVESTTAAYERLNTLPGVTIEPQETVTIRFQ